MKLNYKVWCNLTTWKIWLVLAWDKMVKKLQPWQLIKKTHVKDSIYKLVHYVVSTVIIFTIKYENDVHFWILNQFTKNSTWYIVVYTNNSSICYLNLFFSHKQLGTRKNESDGYMLTLGRHLLSVSVKIHDIDIMIW